MYSYQYRHPTIYKYIKLLSIHAFSDLPYRIFVLPFCFRLLSILFFITSWTFSKLYSCESIERFSFLSAAPFSVLTPSFSECITHAIVTCHGYLLPTMWTFIHASLILRHGIITLIVYGFFAIWASIVVSWSHCRVGLYDKIQYFSLISFCSIDIVYDTHHNFFKIGDRSLVLRYRNIFI